MSEEVKEPVAVRYLRVGEIVHVVSDDGVCAPGIVCMIHDNPDIVRITLCMPMPNAPAMCIGDVRRDDEYGARTWHDMYRCTHKKPVGQLRRLVLPS